MKILFQTLCEKITHHKFRKLILWGEDLAERNFKYPNRTEYTYKCKICGYHFWNHKISQKDLEKVREFYAKGEDL